MYPRNYILNPSEDDSAGALVAEVQDSKQYAAYKYYRDTDK